MCALAAGMAGTPAQAQAPSESARSGGDRSEFRLRLGGQPGQAVVREDSPVPFCLDVKPISAEAGAGTLEIVRLPTKRNEDIEERLLYRAALELPQGRRRRITGYLPPLADAVIELEARWVQHDAVRLRSRTGVRFTAYDEVVVLVTTIVPGRLAPYYPVRPADASQGWSPPWRVAAVDLAAIRTSWTGLRSATCLVLDNPLDSAVDRAWIPAIRRWVESGGTLVVTGGRAGREVAAPFRDLMPVGVLNGEPVTAALNPLIDALGSARVTTTAEPDPTARFTSAPTLVRNGVALARNEAGVAAAYGDLGLGRVVWLGCDPHGAQARLARLGAGAVGVACHARGEDLRFHTVALPSHNRLGWFNMNPGADAGDFGVAADSIAVPPPSRRNLVWSLAAWTVLLALLFGGARCMGRAGTAWVVAVGVSVTAFGGVTAWAAFSFASRAKCAAITLSVGRLGGAGATAVQGPALYVPTSAEAELSLPEGWDALISPGDTKLEPVVPGYAPQGAVAHATLASRSTQRFLAFGRTALGRGVRLEWGMDPHDARKRTVTVVNGTPHALEQVEVHTPERYAEAGTDDDDGNSLGLTSFAVPAIAAGGAENAAPLRRGDSQADLDALRGAARSRAEGEQLSGAQRRSAALRGYRHRGRRLASAMGTTVVVAQLAAPPAGLRIDGVAAPAEGEHVLFLIEAPPAASAATGELDGVVLDLVDPPVALDDPRSRLERVPRHPKRRGAKTGEHPVRRESSATLNGGILQDVEVMHLPPMGWERELHLVVSHSWTLQAAFPTPPRWPHRRQVDDERGTVELLGARDVFTGALVPLRREGKTICIPSPRRFWSHGTITLRFRFRPPALPDEPGKSDENGTGPPAKPQTGWEGKLEVWTIDARIEQR